MVLNVTIVILSDSLKTSILISYVCYWLADAMFQSKKKSLFMCKPPPPSLALLISCQVSLVCTFHSLAEIYGCY